MIALYDRLMNCSRLRYLRAICVSLLLCVSCFISGCATPRAKTVSTVPSASVRLEAGQSQHVIQRGETLYSIASRYSVDLQSIIEHNKISQSARLYPGQVLIIPGTSAAGLPLTSRVAAMTSSERFLWPVKGRLVTNFGEKKRGISSKGVQIGVGSIQDVRASRSGSVAFSGQLSGYGPTVILDHHDGYVTVYGGVSSVLVKCGDAVSQGSVLAKSGRIPRDNVDGLYFEIRRGYRSLNPLFFMEEKAA